MRAARAFIGRVVRATAILARDGRIPRGLRWLAAFGLLPLPGPVDEAVLLVLAPILLVFHRRPLREAWHEAARP